MNGLMEEGTKVIGKTIICMEKEYILGKMVENMKEITLMIKNMDLECIYGFKNL